MVTGWTYTLALLRVTGSLVPTLTDMSAALARVSPWTGLRTSGAYVPQGTHTCPCGGVTCGSILTITLVFTIGTKSSLFTA